MSHDEYDNSPRGQVGKPKFSMVDCKKDMIRLAECTRLGYYYGGRRAMWLCISAMILFTLTFNIQLMLFTQMVDTDEVSILSSLSYLSLLPLTAATIVPLLFLKVRHALKAIFMLAILDAVLIGIFLAFWS